MKKIIMLVLLTMFIIQGNAIEAMGREKLIGDYYEDQANFYGGGVVPEPGQDIVFFSDLPWPELGIASERKIPQWIGYGPSRWTFSTASRNQLSIQGKVSDAGVTVMDVVANLIFEGTKTSVVIGNVLVLIAYHSFLADYIPGFVSDCVAALYGTGLGESQSDRYPLWQFAIGLALVGLGITIAVNFFRAQLVKGITNYAMAALIVAGLIAYFNNVDTVVRGINNLMDQGTALIVTGTYESLVGKRAPAGSSEAFDASLVNITELSWDMFVGRPWAIGQWGTVDTVSSGQESLRLSPSEVERLQKTSVKDMLGVLFDKATDSNATASSTINSLYNAALGVEIPEESRYIDKVYLGANEDTRDKLLATVQNRNSMVHIACGQEWNSAFRHIEWALLSMLPAAAYGILTLALGIPVFISQIFLAVMLIFFPLILIAGITGDSGRRVLMSYSKAMLGLALTKIVYGLYLALTLAISNLVWTQFTENMKTGSQALAMVVITVLMAIAVKKRGKVMGMALSAISGSPPIAETAVGNTFANKASGIMFAGSGMLNRFMGINEPDSKEGDYRNESKRRRPASGAEPPMRDQHVQNTADHWNSRRDSGTKENETIVVQDASEYRNEGRVADSSRMDASRPDDSHYSNSSMDHQGLGHVKHKTWRENKKPALSTDASGARSYAPAVQVRTTGQAGSSNIGIHNETSLHSSKPGEYRTQAHGGSEKNGSAVLNNGESRSSAYVTKQKSPLPGSSANNLRHDSHGVRPHTEDDSGKAAVSPRVSNQTTPPPARSAIRPIDSRYQASQNSGNRREVIEMEPVSTVGQDNVPPPTPRNPRSDVAGRDPAVRS